MIRTIAILGTVFAATPAFAHGGHLGEVAGHGHWIALGAAVGAMAIGAALAKWRKAGESAEKAAEDVSPDADDLEAEAQA